MTDVLPESDLEEDEALSEALRESEVPELDPESRKFVKELVDRIWTFIAEFTDIAMYPYQEEFGKRIIESVITEDGAVVTGLLSRQSGKTETLANVVAGLMVILPRLAHMFPSIPPKFKKGLWVGCFAPVEGQVETLFNRIVQRLTSERAMEIMLDPEIDDRPKGQARYLELKKSGSFVRMQTANPRAKIESKSYHLIIIDEAQQVDEYVVEKSITPMGVHYLATMVQIGTPDIFKGHFYKTIQFNKRRELERGGRKNHFEFNWTHCAKYNRKYRIAVRQTALRIGEDSDEFRLNYRLEWLLERGMFVTEERMDELGDSTMQLLHAWWKSGVIVGVDPARRMDSTVVTVVYIDWDHPDEFGFFHHRILNWMEIHGEDWEEQYFRIVEFLANYNVIAIGVDAQGVGDAVAQRLQVLMPRIQVVPLLSTNAAQSDRWKHLMALIQRGMLAWPAHPKTRRLKMWRRFRQQMVDLEKKYQSGYLLAEAPDTREAHDDYPDSLALACILTKEFIVPEAEEASAPWAGGYRRR